MSVYPSFYIHMFQNIYTHVPTRIYMCKYFMTVVTLKKSLMHLWHSCLYLTSKATRTVGICGNMAFTLNGTLTHARTRL